MTSTVQFAANSMTLLGLDDLTEVRSDEVLQLNRDLALWARRQFRVSGQVLRVQRSQQLQAWRLWLHVAAAGVPVTIALSEPLADLLLQPDQLQLQALTQPLLTLWGARRLANRMPEGVELRAVALERQDLVQDDAGAPFRSIWEAVTAEQGQATGLSAALWCAQAPADEQLLTWLAPWAAGQTPPALAKCSLTWPLVAAHWTVDAESLTDLAPGDVLLLN